MKKDYVRYLKQDKNKGHQDLLKSYLSEMIYSYGVDVRYWRKEIDTFITPAISGEFYNHLYGELPSAPFSISGDMVVHLMVNNDEWMMAQMGIQNTGSYTISFLCDAFEESMRQKLGYETSGNFSGVVSGSILSGDVKDLLSTQILVSGNITDGDVDLRVSENISLGDYASINSIPEYIGISPNSEFIIPDYYENFVELSGSVSGGLDLIELSGEYILSGSVSGDIGYKSDVALMTNPDWKMAPQVGDVFEMLGIDSDLPAEQYEITRIIDKNLADEEMNQFLGRYIWKCDCVRREASSEEFYSNDKSGNKIENIDEYKEDGINENLWQKLDLQDISDEQIFDYKKPEDEEDRTQDDVDIQASNDEDISSVYGNY